MIAVLLIGLLIGLFGVFYALQGVQHWLAASKGLRTKHEPIPALPKWSGDEAPFHAVPRLTTDQVDSALANARVMWASWWRWDATGELFTDREILNLAADRERYPERYPALPAQLEQCCNDLALRFAALDAYVGHRARFWRGCALLLLLPCEALAVVIARSDGFDIAAAIVIALFGWIALLVFFAFFYATVSEGEPAAASDVLRQAVTRRTSVAAPTEHIREDYARGSISVDELERRTEAVLADEAQWDESPRLPDIGVTGNRSTRRARKRKRPHHRRRKRPRPSR